MSSNDHLTCDPAAGRMRVLSVVSSSNQLYSGIGKNIFEIASRLTDRIAFEFAIDDGTPRTTEQMIEFGERMRIPVHVGKGHRADDSPDFVNIELPDIVRSARFDLVECLCWANAATNSLLLSALGDDVPLVYTPHDQPVWTVPMPDQAKERTRAVHRRVVERSDLVLCVSPAERATVQRLAPGRMHCAYLPNGCDFSKYAPTPEPRRSQLLFVGDLAEPRKRFDRVIAVLERLLAEDDDLQLIVVGNRTDAGNLHLSPAVRRAVDARGYVEEEGLRAAYRESLGLFLLSDFEAFGIPILEALACGTPVFITPIETTSSLFRSFRGVFLCPPDDPDASARIVSDALRRAPDLLDETAADWTRLRSLFDWEIIAERKWALLRSAWFRRRGFALSA